VRPGADKGEVLDVHLLGTDDNPEHIIASAAVSNGKVFFASMDNLYCIGKKSATPAPAPKAPPNPLEPAPAGAKPTFVQVVPTELILKPGEKKLFHARLFDEKGRFIREEAAATWSLDRLKGQVAANGELVVAADNVGQAGLVKATVGELSGTARVRVSPPLPWAYDFEQSQPGPPPAFWINGTGKMQVRDVDGNKRLVKLADNPFTKRGRFLLGADDLHDYTTEASVMSKDQKRQMGDAGVIAQRYVMMLFGNAQRVELQAWQPETTRTIGVSFPWKGDTWYRMKLRVESLPEGKTRARGKIWPVGEPEPDAWLVDRVDPIGHRQGSPGIYADAPVEVFFDDIKVSANQ
jgi:hypothetical protein